MTELPNSISAESRVDLFVRISTPLGPRTRIFAGLDRAAASDLAAVLNADGHEAQYFEARGGKPMRAHMKALKRKQARARKAAAPEQNNVIQMSKGKPNAGVCGGKSTGR